MRIPVQVQIDDFGMSPAVEVSDFVTELKCKLQRLYKAQDKCRRMCTEPGVDKYNKKAKSFPYAEGMLVYIKNEAKKPGISAKLQPEYVGPYKLVKQLSEHSFSAENVAKNKMLANSVHTDRMKPVREFKQRKKNRQNEEDADAPGDGAEDPAEAENPIDTGLDTGVQVEQADEKEDETAEVQEPPGGLIDSAGSSQPAWGISNNVYTVERLLKVRGAMGSREYLVKWAPINGVQDSNSWVRAENITPSAIQAFYERHTLAGKVRKGYQRTGPKSRRS
jgi:hypothetical protein